MHKFKIYKNEIIFILLTIIVLLFAWFLLYPLFSYFVVCYENVWAPFQSYLNIPDDSFWQIFTTNDHSWYIYSAFNSLSVRYLPEFFKMHPQVFYSTYYTCFLFLIFMCFIQSLNENLLKYSYKKYITPLLIILILPSVLLIISYSDFSWIFQSPGWILGYIFLPIFGILLMNFLEYFYIQNEKIKKRDWIVIIILLLIVSVSQELYRFMIIVGVPIWFLLNRFYYCNKNFNKILFFLYTGFFLINIVNSNAEAITGRYYQYSLTEFFQYFKEYLGYFAEYIIYNNWLLWVTIIGLIPCIHFFVKDNEKNKRLFIYTTAVIFSMLSFVMAIMFFKNYDIGMNSILQHEGLNFLIKITLLNIIFSLSGYIIAFSKFNEKKLVTILITFYMISIIFIILYDHKKIEYLYQADWNKSTKISMYLIEKFYLLNGKNNPNLYVFYDDCFFDEYIAKYLSFTYKSDVLPNNYKIIPVCNKNEEDLDKCISKMISFAKEKINYNFSTEELEYIDFNGLAELNKK